MVLLHLSAQFAEEHQLKLVAVNVDHGLSPHAGEWQDFCQQQAQQLGVEFIAEQVEVKPKPRQSLEALARELRYQVLAQHVTEQSVLLTGHHNDDQVETYFLQLKRGAGVKGLSAMGAIRRFSLGHLIRPLLSFTRQHLSQFATEHSLSWIEDESNLDLVFDRNFLRHQVIPQLTARWPGFGKAVARSAQLSAEAQTLCDEVAMQDLQKVIESSSEINKNALEIASLVPFSEVRRNNLLRYWITQQGATLPSQQQLQQIWQNLALSRVDANGVVTWSGQQMRRYQGRLFLLQDEPQKIDDVIHLPVELIVAGATSVPLPVLQQSLHCVISQRGERLRLPLKNETASVRFNGSGALCHPVGRSGRRKFKKLMQEYQIPPWQRQQLPLIYYNEQLVAAVGYWLDQRYLSANDQDGMYFSLLPSTSHTIHPI